MPEGGSTGMPRTRRMERKGLPQQECSLDSEPNGGRWGGTLMLTALTAHPQF